MNKKIKGLIKDTIVFGIGNFGSKLILFFLVPLYTNYLSTSEYGTAELVFTVAQLVIPIVTVTIWNGVIRFGLMKGRKPEDVISCGMLVWGLGSLITIAITPFFQLYKAIASWRWYLCIYSISASATQIELNYLKVKEKNRLFSTISLIQTAILAILNIWLLTYLRTGVSGYLISNVVSNIVAAILILFLGDVFRDLKIGRVKRELLIKMILYSAPLILNDISWWVINSSDKIMIEAMLTAGELGLYTVASKIPGLINTFVNIFSQAWGVSSIKEIESTNDNNYYSNVFHYYSILAFGASIFFVAIIKVFMHFYVGNSFRDAWRYVPLLLVAASFSAISSYYGAMYGALQKSVECMLSTVIGGAVNIILNYVLIKSIGTQGAILATLIAFALIAFIRLFGVNRYIHMPITWGSFAIDISIAIVEAVLVSLDFHIVLVSILAIMLFLCIHTKDIAHIVNTFKLVRK